MLNFQGYQLTPGMHEEFQTVEAELSWSNYMLQMYIGGILEAGTLDAGNPDDTSHLRPGLMVSGQMTDGKITQWQPFGSTPSDATPQRAKTDAIGVYIGQISMDFMGTGKDRFVGSILVGGSLRSEAVIIPGEALPGLEGKDLEFLARDAFAGRFVMSDDMNYAPSQGELGADAAIDISADNSYHNTHFINTLGTGTTVTLPAPVPGLRFKFTADGGDIVVGAGAGSILGGNATVTAAAATEVTIELIGVTTATPGTYVYSYVGGVAA